MKEYKELVGVLLLEVYNRQEEGLKSIINCTVPSHIMLVEYSKLDRKLEDLPDEEKKQLWQFAATNYPEKSKEEKIKVCKIVHTVGSLL